ncbi:MAG: aldo/keto reductase [candidate division Zixibacteria bacterium]|nr:aldo/keto reductase [candidate division Zixibacteria bacterium]
MSFEPTILGRTKLEVGRLGLSATYGAPARAVEEAFDHGVNYFYWGALRRGMMAEGIRRLAKKNRERMVVVVQNYWPWAKLIPKSLQRALKELNLDYADVLLFSTFRRRPNQKTIDTALKLKEKGLIRYLGLACHHRPRFAEVEKENIFDVFHIRYNAVHRGAEDDVFPLLPEKDGPGIVIFTATCHTKLLRRNYIPENEKTPRATDCYRFVLSLPLVHVCISGPQNLKQSRENLKILEMGSMIEKELAWMRRVGDHIYHN